jgi:hypothetical protein
VTTLTVKAIGETREWDGKHGRACAIPVIFTDGTRAEYQTKPDSQEKRRDELLRCIGIEGDFILEDAGTFPSGDPKPQKLKDYPGKPSGQADSGAAKSSWYNSEEGVRFTQDQTNRRTALMQSVTALVAHDDAASSNVLEYADRLYTWLIQTPGRPTTASVGPDLYSGEGGTGPAVESSPNPPGRIDDSTRTSGASTPANAEPDSSLAGSAGSEAGDSTVTLSQATASDLHDPNEPATNDQWERLRAVCGGSMTKAVNRLNKANKTNYSKATAVAGATRGEVAAAITGEAA